MSSILKISSGVQQQIEPASFHLLDLQAETAAAVAQARRRAARVLQAARREAADIREAARRAGHAQGQSEGLAAGREAGYAAAFEEARTRFAEEQAQLAGALSQMAEVVTGERAARLHEAERDLLSFALGVARRIVRRLGQLDPEVSRMNLESALARVLARTDLVVFAHPDDCATLRRFAAESAARLEEGTHLRIVPDPQVPRGGVRLRSGVTEVDATLDGQMDMIAAALLGEQ